MAQEESSQRSWRKTALGVFALLAALGLILGLIAAFKPDAYDKRSKGNDVQTKATSPTQTYAETSSPSTVSTPINNAISNVATTVPVGGSGSTKAASGTTSGTTGTTGTTTGTKPAGTTSTLPGATTATISNLQSSVIANMQTTAGCAPANGDDLRAALEGTVCTIITLTPGVRYKMGATETVINGRKVVIGSPLLEPILDGSGAKRLFRVTRGGSLDLSYVITWRGGGELLTDLNIPVLRGGSVFVEAGGRMAAFGVIFTNAPPSGPPVVLIAPDISRAVRVFGGQIYVAGGVLVLTLCNFWVMQPGVLLREIYIVGADVLTVAGLSILTGCTFANSQLFLNGLGVGFQLAHLGGVLVCSGCGFVVNMGVIHASGAGIITFLGGGVGIFQGCAWSLNLGLLAHFGSGVGHFNGGGVSVMNGCAFAYNIGATAIAGTAIMISVGGGVLVKNGVAQEVSVGAAFLALCGVFNWVGSGVVTATGAPMSRTIGAASIYGIGGTTALGSGTMIQVGSPSADSYGVLAAALIGGDFFLGAGVMVVVGSPFIKLIGVGWIYVLGLQCFVGAGLAVYNSLGNVGTPQFGVLALPGSNAAGCVVGAGTLIRRELVVTANSSSPLPALANSMANTVIEAGKASGAADGLPTGIVVMNGQAPTSLGTTSNSMINSLRKNNNIPLEGTEIVQGFADLGSSTNLCETCGYNGSLSDFTGPGAKQCAASTNCTLGAVKYLNSDGVKTQLASYVQNAASQFNSLTGVITMADTSVVASVLRVGCTGATCVSTNDVQEVLTKSIGTDCGMLTVAPRNSAKVSELADDVAKAHQDDFFGDSDVTKLFDVTITSQNPKCTAKLADWAQNTKTSTLAQQLNAVAPANTAVNNLALDYLTTHTVAGSSMADVQANLANAAIAAQSGSLTPSVIVNGKANQLSYPHFTAGDSAEVYLSGFKTGSPVQLVITPSCSATSTGGTPLPDAAYTNADGVVVKVALPVSLPAGDYAIQARQSGLGWCSQAIAVNAKSRRA